MAARLVARELGAGGGIRRVHGWQCRQLRNKQAILLVILLRLVREGLNKIKDFTG